MPMPSGWRSASRQPICALRISTPTCWSTSTSSSRPRQIWPASSVNARLPDVGKHQGKHLARPEPRRRADDLGAGRADRDQGSPDRRWRLDPATRAAACSTCTARRSSRRSPATPTAGCTTSRSSTATTPTHIVRWCAHRVQRPHEKINHALVLGGKQGIGKDTLLEPVKHAIGAVEFPGGVAATGARPVQRLPQVGDPARQRGARPRRVRPLRILRSHEEPSPPRRRTCCASTRRTAPNTRSPTSPASSSRPTTRPTASICRPTTAAISSPGPTSTRAPSRPSTGTSFGTGTTTAAARSSRTTCSTSTSRPSIPRHRRRRPNAFFEIVNASRSPEDAELADALDACIAGLPAWPDAVTIADIIAASLAIRLHRLSQGSQEQPQHPAPLRGLRLHAGAQPRRRRRPVAHQRPPPGHLRPLKPQLPRPPHGIAKERASW